MKCICHKYFRQMRLGAGAHVLPLEKDGRDAPAGRVGTTAFPFIRVRLVSTPELAAEVDARHLTTRSLARSDVVQPAAENGAIAIELER